MNIKRINKKIYNLWTINKKKIIIILLIILIFIIIFIIFFKKIDNFNNEYKLPKDIYCYWDKPNNKLIEAHINTWTRNIPKDWTIHFITKKNILTYVDIDFYNKFKNLPSFRFSDFLRLYLLQKNGGVWMDSSTIMINGNFLDNYWNEMNNKKSDILLYEFYDHSLPGNPYLENWFFMAPKNSPFITDVYNEFEKAYDMDFLEYKKKVLIPNINLENTIGYDEDNTYHLQHAIIQYLLKKNKYSMNIKDANEIFFKVQKITGWNSKKMIEYILNNDLKDIYAIKLVKTNRNGIKDENEFIERLNNI